MSDPATTARHGEPESIGEILPRALAGLPPLLVDAKTAAKLLSIGKTKFYELDRAGRLPCPIRLGHAVRWNAAELAAWTAAGCPSRLEWEARKREGRR